MTDTPPEIYTHEIRVSWGDCDPAKIAYTGRLPAFALEGINGWWEHVLGGDGWFQMELDRNLGTPFVHLSMDFRAPVTPRHRLILRVWPLKLGESSIRFHVDGSQNGTLCFTGTFVCVFIVADQFRKTIPPLTMQDQIRAYLRDETGNAGPLG